MPSATPACRTHTGTAPPRAAAALALVLAIPGLPAAGPGGRPAPAYSGERSGPRDSLPFRVSLREALSLFRENGLELRLARRRYETLEGAASQRGAYPNPSVSVLREELSRPGGEYSETTFGLEQSVEWPGRTLARSRASEGAREAARWQYRADSLRLAGDLREAYLRTARAEGRVEVLGEVAAVFRRATDAGEARRREGDISGYELRRLKLERARLEQRLAAAVLERDAARRALAAMVRPGSEAVAVATRGVPDGEPPPLSREEVVTAAVDRPSVRAARRALEAAEARASAASLGRIPDLDLTGGYKTQSDDFEGAVLGLSLSLPLLDRGSGAVRAARARSAAEAVGLRLEERRARNEVLRAWDRYRSVRRRTDLLGDRLLAPASDLLEIARTGYAAGEMELVELLDGADAYLEARTTALELRAELWASYFELERAMGGRR